MTLPRRHCRTPQQDSRGDSGCPAAVPAGDRVARRLRHLQRQARRTCGPNWSPRAISTPPWPDRREGERQQGPSLLYHLERGLILHYADRYAESNEAFAAAERLADELYTKSISEGALSLISNDNAISYRPRPFEMAMVPYYKGLNYIYLGDRNAAQVEARRASLQMAKYRRRDPGRAARRGPVGPGARSATTPSCSTSAACSTTGTARSTTPSSPTATRRSPTSRTMTCCRWTSRPVWGRDLVRVAGRLGFRDELDYLHQTCPDVFCRRRPGAGLPVTREDYEQAAGWRRGNGEVVLLAGDRASCPRRPRSGSIFPIFAGEAYDDPDYWSWEIYDGHGQHAGAGQGAQGRVLGVGGRAPAGRPAARSLHRRQGVASADSLVPLRHHPRGKSRAAGARDLRRRESRPSSSRRSCGD